MGALICGFWRSKAYSTSKSGHIHNNSASVTNSRNSHKYSSWPSDQDLTVMEVETSRKKNIYLPLEAAGLLQTPTSRGNKVQEIKHGHGNIVQKTSSTLLIELQAGKLLSQLLDRGLWILRRRMKRKKTSEKGKWTSLNMQLIQSTWYW